MRALNDAVTLMKRLQLWRHRLIGLKPLVRFAAHHVRLTLERPLIVDARAFQPQRRWDAPLLLLHHVPRFMREMLLLSRPHMDIRALLRGSQGEEFDLIDLAPLSGLTGLQTLDVSQTQVSDLRPLSRLAGLQGLRNRSLG